jgi:hypothetical protein
MKSFRQAAIKGGISSSPPTGKVITVRQEAKRFMLSPPISLNRLIQNLLSSLPPQPPGQKTVPDLIGTNLTRASQLLQNEGLNLTVGRNVTPAANANFMEVFEQSPVAGTRVATNSTVAVAIILPVRLIILNNQSGAFSVPSLFIWFFNLTTNTWQSFGSVGFQSSINLQLTANNFYTSLVAVNPNLIGCGANDPNNSNCRAWETLIDQGVLGDTGGTTEQLVIT